MAYVEERRVLSRGGMSIMEPAPTHVRQLEPRTRAMSRRNRDQIEKELLVARNSNFERHSEEILAPFEINQQTALFMSDSDRFHTDVAGEARRQRQNARQQKDQTISHLREERLEREQRRWCQLDYEARLQESIMQQQRSHGLKSFKNKSGAAYNPITLQVHNSTPGDELREEEDMVRRRADSRMMNMATRGNSVFNPITHCAYEIPRRCS